MDDAIMNSFDYKMRGMMKFPKMSVTYYRYEYPFFVPPIPCLFMYCEFLLLSFYLSETSISFSLPDYGTEGYWGINFYMKFDILSMLASGTVDPYVGVMVSLSFSSCDLRSGKDKFV